MKLLVNTLTSSITNKSTDQVKKITEKEILHYLKRTENAILCSPFLSWSVISNIMKSSTCKNLTIITRKARKTNKNTMKALLNLYGKEEIETKVLGEELHAKVYLFDAEVAIVTSANLTGKGLRENKEIGVVIKDHEVIHYLGKILEDFLDEAEDLEDHCSKKELQDHLEQLQQEEKLKEYGAYQVWTKVVKLSKKLELTHFIVGNYVLEADHTEGRLNNSHIENCDKRIPCNVSNAQRVRNMYQRLEKGEDEECIKQLTNSDSLECIKKLWKRNKNAIASLEKRLIEKVYTPYQITEYKGNHGITPTHLIHLVCLYRRSPEGKWVSTSDWVDERDKWRAEYRSGEAGSWLKEDEDERNEIADWIEKELSKKLGGSMPEHYFIPLGLLERDKQSPHNYRLTALGKRLVENRIGHSEE